MSNVISVNGGKAHLPHPTFPDWPNCRTYGSNRVGAGYKTTDAEVTCSRCCEQLWLRELAAARQARICQAVTPGDVPAERGPVTTAQICRALIALDKPGLDQEERETRAALLTELAQRHQKVMDRAVRAWTTGTAEGAMSTVVARAVLAAL